MYSPIASTVAVHFETSTNTINALAQVYAFMYLLGSFVAPWMFVKYGLRKTLVINSLLNLLGSIAKPLVCFVPNVHVALVLTFLCQGITVLVDS